jgi:Na+/H+-dicarboxylate symporter/ABC-type amino acid transport substrate-binding protein
VSLTFSQKILVGLTLGIVTGVFLGERALALEWAAQGFVKLLQMTVLPYVTVSIVESLGSLSLAEARRLGYRAGAVLVVLWIVGLVYALLVSVTFPHVQTASFFSTTLLEQRHDFDLVDLYIPSNPFYSLANNVVPAVVLFSIVLGVAIIGTDRKPVLLDVLRVARVALSRATRFIVQLTPYGLFAIAAVAAGTLSLDEIGRLQVFLVAYVGVSLLVALWVLPGMVAAVTPIRARDIFGLTRDALITAFVAGDLFIVLPVLIESSRTLVERAGAAGEEVALPDVIVPASFNFPHTGKLLSISFILFAGWFSDSPVPVLAYPRLALTGLVTFFGSINSAVPFLLDLFHVPADTFQLFVASSVINARFGTLVAAMHTLAVALLSTCAMTGLMRFDRARIVRYLVITAVLTAAVIGGTRVIFGRVFHQEYTKDKVLAAMHLKRQTTPATVHRVPAATPSAPERGPILSLIKQRGALRVGYLRDSLPYAFFNAADELVGLDVEMAYHLAAELNVPLEFVPIDRERMVEQVNLGDCDILMSGVAITTMRASQMTFSTDYVDETMAFIVLDSARGDYASWSQLEKLSSVRLGIQDVPYYIQKMHERLPAADLKVLQSPLEFFRDHERDGLDALVFAAERGSAWTLMYPNFTVVIPEPNPVRVPLAYAIGQQDQAFATFVNTWIELKKKDGTIDSLYKYWILGQDAAPKHPRWSIIRDVLHWTKD